MDESQAFQPPRKVTKEEKSLLQKQSAGKRLAFVIFPNFSVNLSFLEYSTHQRLK